jgi:hypothetical protein
MAGMRNFGLYRTNLIQRANVYQVLSSISMMMMMIIIINTKILVTACDVFSIAASNKGSDVTEIWSYVSPEC